MRVCRCDGSFVYEWDEKGRLTSVTEKPTSANGEIRRILYDYDGNDRLVGRRAEMAEVTDPAADPDTLSWELETRADVLASDGLPADVGEEEWGQGRMGSGLRLSPGGSKYQNEMC
ncbi:MAG: RHS repeat domain-containing protein [Thermoanaerobaculia bacterium]